MIFISDELLIKISDLNDKINLFGFFNKKKYRVAHSTLSYRQVNELGNDELLDDQRKSEREWRAFSLKELAFCEVAAELKKFGLENVRLHNLHKAFFSLPELNDPKKKKGKFPYADLALAIVFGGTRVVLVIDQNYQAAFYSDPYFELVGEKQPALIFVNFNFVVGTLIKRLGIKTGLGYKTTFDFLIEEMEEALTDAEKKVIQLIRCGKYTEAKIIMKNGEVTIFSGRQIKRDQFTLADFAKMISEKSYATIKIQMEDGQVVVHEIENKQKIS